MSVPPPGAAPPRVERLIARLVAERRVSAVTALTGTVEGVTWTVEAGHRDTAGMERVGPGTLYDLASLTKPWTATLAVVLDATGQLPLALPLGEVWPEAPRELRRRRLEDLLRHRAGLIPWTPLYRCCASSAEVPARLLGGSNAGARAGTYSDLDFILWGLAAERWTGRRLPELLRTQVLEPLGIGRTALASAPEPRRTAACPLDNRRERELAAGQGIELPPLGPPARGQPQDGNARFLGPAAAHAGLFGTAEALWRLGRAWLLASAPLTATGVATALGGGGRFALGWMRRRVRGAAGRALAPGAFGHTGFTGGSLWIDPERQVVHVLLAHRSTVEVDLQPVRRRFHRLAVGP